MSRIALKLLEKKSLTNNKYLNLALKKEGAIAAVERIKRYGVTETDKPINWSKWLEQQTRITADSRVKNLITTGASQISKSLINYLVAIDDVVNGQVNIGWVYASRSSMQNQQPTQFQAMVGGWLARQKTNYRINRDAITRYGIGKAIANFTYANSVNESRTGGAAEGKEQNAFQASKLYLEEKSSHGSCDMTPRLGASVILSKPIRELGTPGNGTGIEKSVKNASHNFVPGIKCDLCGKISRLHPLGNLFKKDPFTQQYFDSRGHIIDYYQNKAGEPTIVCNHCYHDIYQQVVSTDAIELYSEQSGHSVDEFLDELNDNQIYFEPIAIYLSPLLRCPTDPFRLKELVEEGKNPESVLIFHQNKLGIESKFTLNGISFEDLENAYQEPWKFKHPRRFVGIDQGTDTHYLVDLEVFEDKVNLKNAIVIRESEVVKYLRYHRIDFAIIDNEPGRKSANTLANQSGGKLAIADQRDIMTDFSPIKVEFGGEQIDCYAINNTLYQEEVIYDFMENKVRIDCSHHPKFGKHITAVKRDLTTGKFIRPADHDDDFFFAYMFARSAIAICPRINIGASSIVSSPLQELKYTLNAKDKQKQLNQKPGDRLIKKEEYGRR